MEFQQDRSRPGVFGRKDGEPDQKKQDALKERKEKTYDSQSNKAPSDDAGDPAFRTWGHEVEPHGTVRQGASSVGRTMQTTQRT